MGARSCGAPRRRGLGAAALLAASACGGPPAPDRLPHVVLITADALRADHLSLNGYPRETSPALDAFAARAWHFANAVSVVPKTGPSFATLFTGYHPEEHQVRDNFEAIPETMPVLAEQLRDLGYRTAAFVGNPVLRPSKGFARGFDRYETHRTNVGGVEAMSEAFHAWVEAPWREPTFVWLHLMDPHGPYLPPPELLALFENDEWARSDARVPLEADPGVDVDPDLVLGSLPEYQRLGDEDRVAVFVARYDAEIRHTDAAFGRAIAALERLGVFDESLIVFTSDHGESLGEHDYYFEHGWFAYDATLRVPLLIKLPGQRQGRVVRRQVSLLDVMPTVSAAVGLDAGYRGAGRDLAEPLVGAGAPVLVESSDGYPVKYHGIRSSEWKYVVRDADRAEELYDLATDPGETRNLAERMPDRSAELRLLLGAALRGARRNAVPANPGLADDAETLEQLEALGYVE